MESLFSIIATGDHQLRENADLLLEELGTVFERMQPLTGLDKRVPEQMYRRILMALLTGNGDLHLDNTSIIGGVKECGLSPVYDPAPMRAWPRHNIVSAIPFDPTGHEDHGEYFVSLGASFGLSSKKVKDCLMHALDATADYVDRIKKLKKIPDAQRNQLVEIVMRERELLKRHL
jgi:serine/threonine-protein kinase HipA